jgi:O-antigen/teichoic acid export membrane protein
VSKNKIIAKNSLILYTSLIVTSVLGLITTRYVLLYLGVSDFGLYSVVGGIVVVMGFINSALIATTYRFIAFEMGRNEGRDVNKIFNISLIIHVVMAVFLLLLAETVGVWYVRNHLTLEVGKLDDALVVFRLSVLATAINIISIPHQGFLTAIEKFSIRSAIDIQRSVFHLVLVMLLGVYGGNKLVGYAIITTILALVASGLLIIYCKTKHAHFVSFNFQKDKYKYREMLSFSAWTLIGGAASVGKDTGSQLIINSFFGTVLNASFGIANRLNSFVNMFALNLAQVAVPQITKSHSSGDSDRSRQLVTYIGKYTFFMVYLPTLPLLLETEFLLELWLDEVPTYTVEFCRLMLITNLISAPTAGFPAAIQASGRIKWFQLFMSIIMLLALPVSYILFKIGMQPSSILIVYTSTTLINLVVGIILMKRILNFDVAYLMKNAFLKIFIILCATLPLFLLVESIESSMQRFVLLSSFSLIWLLASIYFWGINSIERNSLVSFGSNRLKILRKK